MPKEKKNNFERYIKNNNYVINSKRTLNRKPLTINVRKYDDKNTQSNKEGNLDVHDIGEPPNNVHILESENKNNLVDKNKIVIFPNHTTNHTKFDKKSKILIAVLSVVVLILIVVLPCCFLVVKKGKGSEGGTEKKEENQNNEKKDEENSKEIVKINEELKKEALKVFQSNFKISSKPDKLTQILMKYTKYYNSSINGIETSQSIFTKAKYDIYTLNETESDSEDKDFYTTKYTTTITINSFCTEFSSEKNDCELKRYLDLTIKNNKNDNNLRRNDEKKRDIKKAIIPLCIIEHTDTNLILSVTCPETLSDNLKNDIIQAFESIKPDSIKGRTDDETSYGLNVMEKDYKIYINKFFKECDNNYNGDTSRNKCETIKNIITDKDGNLISSIKIKTEKIFKNENDYYFKNLTYAYEDISQQITYFDPANYKYNLNIIFNLVNSLMIKDNYYHKGIFNSALEYLMKNSSIENDKSIRRLYEDNNQYIGFKELNIFQKQIHEIDLALNLQNDIGLGENENAKAISNFQLNGSNYLSYEQANIRLNETLNKFITLSKAGNKLASQLFENLNQPILDLRDKINIWINDLNDILAFKDLSPIFDISQSIDEINKLPYSFVIACENLYNNLNEINNNIGSIVSDKSQLLKNEISSFIINSRNLLSYIFHNLTKATNSLSSDKSRIAEISSYYLNNTDTSYVDIISKAKEILNNYYINEKNKIEPILNELIDNFNENYLNSINFELSDLKTIRDKLDNEEMSISYVTDVAEIKNTIRYLYNSEILVNDIMSNTEEIFEKSINLQDTGYFISQKDLELNQDIYGGISNEAMAIAQTLDNNLFIDTTFDEIMTYFKEKINNILDYIQKSKIENFPFEENVLNKADLLFSTSSINKLDNDLEKQKLNILNNIKDENSQYLKMLNSTKFQNETNLNEIISNLQYELSEMNLEYIESVYNETFYNVTKTIKELIENNKILAVEYMTNVNNASSSLMGQLYKDKVAIYLENINQIRSYIKNNLRNELSSKYKKIIDQIKNLLRSIK